MWPRKLLDIEWFDLAYGIYRCFRASDGNKQLKAVEQVLGEHDHRIACLSVRTGLDLLLQSLELPAGSEVIMTAVTIPDMIEIVRRHGLVPVPVDLCFETLTPTIASLAHARTDKTRLMVVAHLFGSWNPLDRMIEFSRAHQIFMIEDCVQSFVGWDCIENTGADASLYSFGPIKTSTSLGGALIRVRDPQLAVRMRRMHAQYPIQNRTKYLRRLMKYTLLKLASSRFVYAWIFQICKLCRQDPDLVINALAKNFGKGDLLKRIREQPCGALISLLDRRRRTYRLSRIEERTRLGNALANQLKAHAKVPGMRSERHSYWVFPIVTQECEPLVRFLHQKGIGCYDEAQPDRTPSASRRNQSRRS